MYQQRLAAFSSVYRDMPRQQTICRPVMIEGVGLHSGKPVSITMHPAKINTGIVFRRVDIAGKPEIPALWQFVQPSPLCTTLKLPAKNGMPTASVRTIEHLLAALAGMEIDNVRIDINSEEVPILDGSAAPFVAMIESCGIRKQNAAKKYIRVLKTVSFQQEGKHITLHPADCFQMNSTIDFPAKIIGRQQFRYTASPLNFRNIIASARTFTNRAEVEQLQAAGLALGGSLENAVVVDDAAVLNPEGLRFANEFIRHKILDAIGDLALAGAPLLARYVGEKPGHYLHFCILESLFADAEAFEIVDAAQIIEEQIAEAAPALYPAVSRAAFASAF